MTQKTINHYASPLDTILEEAKESNQVIQLYSNNQIFCGQVVEFTDTDLFIRAIVIDGEEEHQELALWYVKRETISSLCFRNIVSSIESLNELLAR